MPGQLHLQKQRPSPPGRRSGGRLRQRRRYFGTLRASVVPRRGQNGRHRRRSDCRQGPSGNCKHFLLDFLDWKTKLSGIAGENFYNDLF